jgi:hypothetical protein
MATENDKLQAQIDKLTILRSEYEPHTVAYTNFTNDIVSIRNQLTALIQSQQGKFPDKFPLFFSNLFDKLFSEVECHNRMVMMLSYADKTLYLLLSRQDIARLGW